MHANEARAKLSAAFECPRTSGRLEAGIRGQFLLDSQLKCARLLSQPVHLLHGPEMPVRQLMQSRHVWPFANARVYVILCTAVDLCWVLPNCSGCLFWVLDEC